MLKNKKALVTGSSRGIGRKIVELFLANGAEVWGLCSRPSDARGELEALAAEKGTAFHEICADCADAAALSETVKAALSESGGFDVLVNNAGIYVYQPLTTTPAALQNEIINLDITALT